MKTPSTSRVQTRNADPMTRGCNRPESHTCMSPAHLLQTLVYKKDASQILAEFCKSGMRRQTSCHKINRLLWPLAIMTNDSHSPVKSFASMYSFCFNKVVTSTFGVGFPNSS